MRDFLKALEDYSWAAIIAGIFILVFISEIFEFILKLIGK